LDIGCEEGATPFHGWILVAINVFIEIHIFIVPLQWKMAT